MATLGYSELKSRLSSGNETKRLVVTPILYADQLGPSGIDIRLGSSILVPRKTSVGLHDVTKTEVASRTERELYERVRLTYGQKFVLHPNELILGGMFEYISLPNDLVCTITSRSSWGRLGLVVATASVFHPGYKGSPTLELANVSETPIALYPGLSVGQLIFQFVLRTKTRPKAKLEQSPEVYHGRYYAATEPQLPSFFAEGPSEDIARWGEDRWRTGKGASRGRAGGNPPHTRRNTKGVPRLRRQ